ncbi:hypothetical protein AS156_11110 [Bradyrhizobium macuxiense]|uniref:Glycosyltransferase subfamily 4-like N-terminal domain-containing protein n=2 Tax=Bradyrhizobium macuxiense TaxID=1755647 RepID=A0A109JNU3_9BRAD|nr:hypothetical protein AS156_11110 [Bradyrhizobium macuxiense]
MALFYREGELIRDVLASRVELRFLDKRSRWDAFGALRNVMMLLNEKEPHILCTFLPVPNLVAAGSKLLRPRQRLACGIRASNVDLKRYDGLTRLSYKLDPFAFAIADLVISNSRVGKNIAMANGTNERKIRVIPNGIDIDRFEYEPLGRLKLRELWCVAEHELLVGIIGRLDPMKDHQTFIRAASRVVAERPNVRFVIVGDDGPVSRESLLQLAKSLGVDYQLRWSRGRDDMAATLSACDIICSSSAYGEGFSNTLAEAMACGRRCVATDVGDARTILGHIGHIVTPSNDEMLANTINKALDEVQLSGAYSVAARDHIVQNFSLPVMVSAFESEFMRLSSASH